MNPSFYGLEWTYLVVELGLTICPPVGMRPVHLVDLRICLLNGIIISHPLRMTPAHFCGLESVHFVLIILLDEFVLIMDFISLCG